MSSVHSITQTNRITIEFQPGLSERHPKALDCVRECAHTHKHPLKTLAANMDLSPSDLSRKIANNPDDPRRFTLDDLERFLDAKGDMRPIYYLIEKYLTDQEERQRRALAELIQLAPQLAALIRQATK